MTCLKTLTTSIFLLEQMLYNIFVPLREFQFFGFCYSVLNGTKSDLPYLDAISIHQYLHLTVCKSHRSSYQAKSFFQKKSNERRHQSTHFLLHFLKWLYKLLDFEIINWFLYFEMKNKMLSLHTIIVSS